MMTPVRKMAATNDADDQQRAASNPTASVWVNASAGSGKTKVLTDRVARLLLSGVKPESILCLTYTRAGAAEMANRVTSILSKWAVCDDNDLSADLGDLQAKAPSKKQMIEARRLFARVLSCPGGLRIRTIHSFCQEILSRFPIEAGLPPHFSLIDERETDTLGQEVLDDLLREIGEDPEHELAKPLSLLVTAQGEHGFTKMLQEAMRARKRLSEGLEIAGGERALIAQMRAFLDLGPGETANHFRAALMQKLPEEDLRPLALWLAEGSKSHQERGKLLGEILNLPPAARTARFEVYRSLFLTKDNAPYKIFANKEILLKYPQIETFSSREAALLQQTMARIEAAEIAEVTECVLSFGHAYGSRIAARKAERAALDYDDLILFTESLLRREGIAPWILYKLDNGLDHILVDEAQDTSRAQWNIVQSLTAEFYAGLGARNSNRTMFVVGDEKQSIFSFQNADPDAFLVLRDAFSKHAKDAGKELNKIGLHTSYRSASKILEAVDEIFFDENVRFGVSPELITHKAAKDRAGRVEIWPLLKPTKEEQEESGAWAMPMGYEEENDPQAELAQQIARKIGLWLKRGEALEGTGRLIAPGDIMILLRRRGRFADLMVRALKGQKVPVTGVDRMKLVAQLPVMDLLAMLRFVLLPEDDLNLASLLRSPLLGLSEEHLMELAIGRPSSLWQSLKDRAALSKIYGSIHTYLAQRLNEADFSTPFAFLSQILSLPCPANKASGRKALWTRLGAEAQDPIEELLNEAQSFGQNHSPSLQNFLQWLTKSDIEIKRELDQGGGQVRIMTVHASKGLEAPIVFLPDTVAVPRSSDISKFQWSESGIPLFLTRQPQFGAAQKVWGRACEKQMQEYRRLFYVALTRAANRLYICGWLGKKGEKAPAGSWYSLSNVLQNKHQDSAVLQNESPLPEVAFADNERDTPSLAGHALSQVEDRNLPAWALQPVVEPITTSTISHASPAAATPDAAFARGRIIHRLLQSLPEITPENRSAALMRYLSHPRHALKDAERDEIAQEVMRLLTDSNFTALFAPTSLAEAPLTGTLHGMAVFRQVDRLCLMDNEVWIVDYKTNRPPPSQPADIPKAYLEQMAEYRLLLEGIYPGKRIRCFLLWTYAPKLMEVPN